MSTKSGILSVFSGTYQVTQKGAVSTLPQLRFQRVFYFLLRFTVTATAAAATHRDSRRTYRSILTGVLGIFPAFTVLPSDETVSSVAT